MLPLTRSLVARGFTSYFFKFRPQSISHFKSLCAREHLTSNYSLASVICPRGRILSTQPPKSQPKQESKPPESQLTFDQELAQLSFFQRYKKLLKEFWYVLLPVHGITSALWFGSLWLVVKSGVKIDLNALVNILPFPLPQPFEDSLKNPHLGALALTFALYKLATPFRYMSTVYVAVPTIKILVRKDIIKPLPKLTSSRKIQKEMTRIRNRIVKKRGSDP